MPPPHPFHELLLHKLLAFARPKTSRTRAIVGLIMVKM
jgi:hypothetical protein